MRNDGAQRAVELLDKLLAERPEKPGSEFSEATRCLTEYRDELIGQYRAGTLPRARLDVINAVLSIVVSAHFPLGPVPWEKLQMARRQLASWKRVDRPPSSRKAKDA